MCGISVHEFTFIYDMFQSALMSACFAKFHPNLVVGGTYSGQIVLWDNRVLKRTPIQRTPLSASAHTVCVTLGFVQLLYYVKNIRVKHLISKIPVIHTKIDILQEKYDGVLV